MSDQPISPPAYTSAPIVVPSQLRLHWILVLIISGIVNKFLGGGIGTSLWLLLQARWVRTVTGESKAYNLAIASIAVYAVTFVSGFFTSFSSGSANASTAQNITTIVFGGVMILSFLIGVVIYVIAAFALRTELEAAPFGIKLGPFMTFFFGPIYFQYHLQKWGLPGEVGGPPKVIAAPPPPAAVPLPPVAETPALEASAPEALAPPVATGE